MHQTMVSNSKVDDTRDGLDHTVTAESGLSGRRTAPDEVLEPATNEEYQLLRRLTDYREPYRIAPQYLNGTKKRAPPLGRPTPLIVFINAKSGGRVGPRLSLILSRTIGQSQVFDVTETRPADVLSTLWRNLNDAESEGDGDASYIRNNLRILVAGGDGTVTWVLGAIAELQLDPMPPVAVLPLGTGNDFALNFGWGSAFQWNWFKPVELYRTLLRYETAQPRRVDIWRAEIQAPAASFFAEMPHSLHLDPSKPTIAVAKFWNYFSLGLDAEAAYSFHALRERHPSLASARLLNQAWYAWFSCTTGWFCGAPPLSPNIKLRIKGTGGWQEIAVPPSIRAIVLLNLQTYGGGRDIWGLAHSSTLQRKGLNEPIYDDGLIEVLGFRGGWHTAVVMGQFTPRVHAKRLAQCSELEIEVLGRHRYSSTNTKRKKLVYMQLDGEPWPQVVPSRAAGEEAQPLRVKISLQGSSRVLLNDVDAQGAGKAREVTARGSRIGHLEEEWAGLQMSLMPDKDGPNVNCNLK